MTNWANTTHIGLNGVDSVRLGVYIDDLCWCVVLPPATHQSPKCYHPCYPPVRGGASRISKLRISANATTLLHTKRSKLPPTHGGAPKFVPKSAICSPPDRGGASKFSGKASKTRDKSATTQASKTPTQNGDAPPCQGGGSFGV